MCSPLKAKVKALTRIDSIGMTLQLDLEFTAPVTFTTPFSQFIEISSNARVIEIKDKVANPGSSEI